MESTFYIRLFQKLLSSLHNEHKDNKDPFRHANEKDVPLSFTAKVYNSKVLKKRFLNKSSHESIVKSLSSLLDSFAPYWDKLSAIYELLNDQQSKDLLVDIMAYRLLGKTKIKLALNNPFYWENLALCERLEDKTNPIPTGFLNIELGLFDLKTLGHDIKANLNPMGVLIDFILEQYRYKSNDKIISAQKGDTVIDAGGCWGDTALYFASKVGQTGKVFTYEFIPSNLKLFKQNIALNPQFSSVINIIENPVWEHDGLDTYFSANGPASRVSFEDFDDREGMVKTKTIDTLVKEQNLSKVDFIKMDIEGSELPALKGARDTINKHRPDLAIAIYHSMDDFVNIPLYIESLNLGYKFYLGHYTLHTEETVIFATTK
jgi:FkbM family methyltransferase